ncbi:hypothetical protein EV421DRAFT_755498 [Armillaria borealis]|uniref:Uncharacterized protein n=1 Tax=Armillaria borealis TaxID=47425 RepID=A0AA39M5J3_9AGAR|nr:hypothetical protein EV421DRAFT_755498 [Armillaria borealis]
MATYSISKFHQFVTPVTFQSVADEVRHRCLVLAFQPRHNGIPQPRAGAECVSFPPPPPLGVPNRHQTSNGKYGFLPTRKRMSLCAGSRWHPLTMANHDVCPEMDTFLLSGLSSPSLLRTPMESLYLDVFSPRLRRRSLCTRTCTSGIRSWRLPSYADGRAHDRAGFLGLLLQHPCLLPPPVLKDHSPMKLQCQYAQAIVGIKRLASPCGRFPESGDYRVQSFLQFYNESNTDMKRLFY